MNTTITYLQSSNYDDLRRIPRIEYWDHTSMVRKNLEHGSFFLIGLNKKQRTALHHADIAAYACILVSPPKRLQEYDTNWASKGKYPVRYMFSQITPVSRKDFEKMLNIVIGQSGLGYIEEIDEEFLKKYWTEVEESSSMKNIAKKWTQTPDPELIKICESTRQKINARFGENSVHETSVIDVVTMFEMINNQKSHHHGIMIAPFQAGKTERMILLAHAYPEMLNHFLKTNDAKVGIVFVTNKSQNTLRDQTRERLEETGFKSRGRGNIKIKTDDWRPSLINGRKVIVCTAMISSNAGARLKNIFNAFSAEKITHYVMLLDETHIAISVGQQLHNFFKKHPDIHIIGVTATPYQKFLIPDVVGDQNEVYYHYCEPGDGYYGFSEMLQEGRFKHFDMKEIEKGNEDALYQECLAAVEDCEENAKNSGQERAYILVRKETNNDNIHEAFSRIAKEKGWQDPIRFDSSGEDRPINELSSELEEPPHGDGSEKGHQFIVIKNALGAGDTICTDHNCGWFESRYSDLEAVAQSLGRSCGYGRSGDTYPIFCNIEIPRAIVKLQDMCRNGEVLQMREMQFEIPSSGENNFTFRMQDEAGNEQEFIQPTFLQFGTFAEFKDVWNHSPNKDRINEIVNKRYGEKAAQKNRLHRNNIDENRKYNLPAILMGIDKLSPNLLALRFNVLGKSKSPARAQNENNQHKWNQSWKDFTAMYPIMFQDDPEEIGCWVKPQNIKIVSIQKRNSIINAKDPSVLNNPKAFKNSKKNQTKKSAATVGRHSKADDVRTIMEEMKDKPRKNVVEAIATRCGLTPNTANTYYQKFKC